MAGVRLGFGALLLAAAGLARADGTPATIRVDYYHTGGQDLDVYAVGRVVVEPLPWPGNPARAIDGTNLGNFRFLVRDAQGTLLYSRGYDTVFAEWETTPEAATSHRTFEASLRFPMPAGPVTVTVQKRDDMQQFVDAWSFKVDPADPYVVRTPPPKQALIEVERHGPSADKVDVLLLGDGYTTAECAGKFRDDLRRATAALFAHEPFRSRRSDFNVWGLCPPAAVSGISRPSTGVERRSPVSATYDAFGSERYILTFDDRALREVAAWAPYEFLTILTNSESYGGGGIFGDFSTFAAGNDWSDYLFVHEFGHHFAALADEYYTSPVAYEPRTHVVEPWQPNVTASADPKTLKWRRLLAADAPVPTPWPKVAFEAKQREFQARRKEIRAQRRPESEMSALFREERAYTTQLFADTRYRGAVGAFQGANYDAQAYYRPQMDCVMFSRDEVPFCRVCQDGLSRIIDLYAGSPH
ncbi:MAG: M64 family metallopeptidase [Steroidobacteraceae bacterium]